MALILVATIVLGPLALLVVDIFRGPAKQEGSVTAAPVKQVDGDGHRIRAPRPKWPAPVTAVQASGLAPAIAPRNGGLRPTGGRRDYFGDGTLDRSA